jgi:hypothetical protein
MHPTSPDGRGGLTVKADAITSEGAGGPSVSTDQTDYYPGDTVIITGTAWQPYESIALRLEETPTIHDPLEWNVTADSVGDFTDRTFVVEDHDFGASFKLYATGAASADTAQFAFTDANLDAKTNVEQVTSVTWTRYSAANTCTGASPSPATGGPSTVNTSGTTLYSGIPAGGSVKVNAWTSASGLKFMNWSKGPVTLTDSLACLNNNGSWVLNLGYLTATAISAAPPSPSTVGDLVTFSATVTKTFDNTAVAPNKVKFYDGGTNCTTGLGTQIIGPSGPNGENTNGAGIATLATSTLTAGVHTIWACYQEGSGPGGSWFFASGNSMSFTVNGLGPTKLVITTADINGVVGQCYGPITVQSQNAGGTPTNVLSAVTVNLSTDDAGTLYSDACTTVATSVTISSGTNSTTFYYKPTAVGNSPHTLTAADNASVLTSDTQDETVSKAATSTVLTSNINPSVYGQNVTLTATISVTAPGSGSPTGNVNFYEFTGVQSCTALGGAVAVGSQAVSGGTAAISLSTLAAGSHPLTACYVGDLNYLASNGGVTQVVNQAATSTVLTSSLNPSEYGQNVTLTATISVTAPGSGSPTGNVNFYEFTGAQSCAALGAAVALGSQAVSSGTAAITLNTLAVGSHPLTACYVGDLNFLASSGGLTQVVNPATTTLVLGVAPASQQYSDTTVFTATVTPYSILTQELTGTVYFYVAAASVTCGLTAGLPTGSVGTAAIADADNGVGSFRYRVSKPAGSYVVTACFYSTNTSFTNSNDTEALTVTAENAVVFDADYTPQPATVLTPGGLSSPIVLTLKVREKYPETNLTQSGPGGTDSAVVTAAGTGILSPSNQAIFGCVKGATTGTGYSQYTSWTCTTTLGLPADTYDVVITINSNGYWTGSDGIVVQVTDPSLGFATGGGWITLGGDRVNFGFQAKATVNKTKTNYQGSVLVIRHLPDGSIIRAKSNVFDGYAIVGTTATFTGKATYSVNGTSLGNFTFTGYAEDNGTPGKGVDKFGFYLASAGNQIATSTTLAGLPASAIVLGGGNIQVPQPGR